MIGRHCEWHDSANSVRTKTCALESGGEAEAVTGLLERAASLKVSIHPRKYTCIQPKVYVYSQDDVMGDTPHAHMAHLTLVSSCATLVLIASRVERVKRGSAHQ
jgi:hypothetical protein